MLNFFLFFILMSQSLINSKNVFIIAGPSGAGKTSLTNKLFENKDGQLKLERLISYTTRAPRIGEQEGFDFHFVKTDVFEQLFLEQFFIIRRDLNSYSYGLPNPLTKTNGNWLAIIDTASAIEIYPLIKHCSRFIFITAPSIDELQSRISNRATDSIESQNNRYNHNVKELEKYSNNKEMFDCTIINDNFDTALAELSAFINSHITP